MAQIDEIYRQMDENEQPKITKRKKVDNATKEQLKQHSPRKHPYDTVDQTDQFLLSLSVSAKLHKGSVYKRGFQNVRLSQTIQASSSIRPARMAQVKEQTLKHINQNFDIDKVFENNETPKVANDMKMPPRNVV